VRRSDSIAARQPGHLGRGGAGARLARWAGLLAGCRDGLGPAAAVLVCHRWHPDRRPVDARGASLRAPDDAQHGSTGAQQAPPVADEVVHSARRRPARGENTWACPSDRRSRSQRRGARTLRLRQGHGSGPTASHPGGGTGSARRRADAPLRLIEPGHRLPGPRLRLVRRIRPGIGYDDGPGSPPAAPVAGPRRLDASPRTREGMPDLYAYAHLLAEEKRRRPGNDVMSILLAQVDDDGGQVSVEEFENMFWLFAVAGNETLRNGLPGACIGLLDYPSLQDELREDPSLLPGAVEELLRWWTPVMTFRRTAASDC